MRNINHVSGTIVDAAMKVHTHLGPGLLESVYEICLAHELRKRGLKVQQQVHLPVLYEGIEIEAGYRLDLVVEDVVVIELKAVETVLDRKSTRLNSSHIQKSRMPSSA